ncbi:MAG TPA: hypothetical protein VGF28_11055 [Thermoanaerobaculia bacterium]|jgi:hypothetical protein
MSPLFSQRLAAVIATSLHVLLGVRVSWAAADGFLFLVACIAVAVLLVAADDAWWPRRAATSVGMIMLAIVGLLIMLSAWQQSWTLWTVARLIVAGLFSALVVCPQFLDSILPTTPTRPGIADAFVLFRGGATSLAFDMTRGFRINSAACTTARERLRLALNFAIVVAAMIPTLADDLLTARYVRQVSPRYWQTRSVVPYSAAALVSSAFLMGASLLRF